jgi:hypothetical protein
MIKKIINGHELRIDKSDLAAIQSITKNQIELVKSSSGQLYPSIRYVNNEGKRVREYIARMIMTPRKKQAITYGDRNPLNVTRANMQVVTAGEAKRAKSKSEIRNCTSEYLGVSWVDHAGKWKAMIKPGRSKSNKHIGYYDNEADAAQAYNTEAKKVFGAAAVLNDV